MQVYCIVLYKKSLANGRGDKRKFKSMTITIEWMDEKAQKSDNWLSWKWARVRDRGRTFCCKLKFLIRLQLSTRFACHVLWLNIRCFCFSLLFAAPVDAAPIFLYNLFLYSSLPSHPRRSPPHSVSSQVYTLRKCSSSSDFHRIKWILLSERSLYLSKESTFLWTYLIKFTN